MRGSSDYLDEFLEDLYRKPEYREAVDVLMGKRWAWEAEFRDSWGYSCAKREAYSRYAGLKLAAEGEMCIRDRYGPHGIPGASDRRDRNRKGAVRPRGAQRLQAQRRPLCGHQCGGHAGEPVGELSLIHISRTRPPTRCCTSS